MVAMDQMPLVVQKEIDMKIGGGNKKIVVGCVADNTVKFLEQAARLLASWRWFGGSLSSADFHVCTVDEVPESFRVKYERYGAKVHLVPRFSERHPPSNKLRFLELAEIQDADWVLLLDCDTVVVQDPSAILSAGADFVAKPADFPTVTQDAFLSLFRAFNLPMPSPEYRCTVNGEPTVPYFNAGVLAFSRHAMATLVPQWIDMNHRLIDQLELLGDCSNFCEQASLTLALANCGTTMHALGNEMNFPAHCVELPLDSDFVRTDPVIIHYHWMADKDGYLTRSPYPKVDARIQQFNERLREERRREFDNRAYWNGRYAMDMDLGSGIGSRGYVRSYKRELLRCAVERLRPRSVLDVGCGDMAVGDVLPEEGYTGIDISDGIVALNSSLYPARQFVRGDLLTLDLEPADLVVCLDVIIHLPSVDEYRRFVARLVALGRSRGIVAGYETPPAARSEITFFHEPLSHTLASAGAHNIRQIGAYRQVTVFSFDTRSERDDTSNAASADLRRPIFIVGAMRSGTTLLAELLGRSPSVCHCAFELKDLWSRECGFPMASAKTRDELCPELGVNNADQEARGRLARAFAERMRACGDKTSDAVFLNKNPHLCNKLAYVYALFPDARFIWIYRHLPQVVASLKRLFGDVLHRQTTWHWWPEPALLTRYRCWNASHECDKPLNVAAERVFPGGRVRYLAEYWLESNCAVSEFFAGLPAGVGFTVAYEALVAEPGVQLAYCLARMELPFFDVSYAEEGIDTSRNGEWISLLKSVEREELRAFVVEHAAIIDSIWPGEASAALYASVLDSPFDTEIR